VKVKESALPVRFQVYCAKMKYDGYSGKVDHLFPAQIDHPKLSVQFGRFVRLI
jgi:hypothetical protein